MNVVLDDQLADARCELTRLRAALVLKDEELRAHKRLRGARKRMLGVVVDSGRIWGYARASTDKQDTSCEMQEDMIREKAVKLPGQLVKVYVDEATSGRTIRWEDRDGFRALMEVIGPGDHLVVWRLDRIERQPFGMLDAVRWLVDQGVSIHILEQGGMQLDLDTAMGRAMVMFMAIFAGFFVDQLSEATAQGLEWRKGRGLSYSPLPIGKLRQKRTIPDPRRPGKEVEESWDVWDTEECSRIREIWRRHEMDGESLVAISRDIYGRRAIKLHPVFGVPTLCVERYDGRIVPLDKPPRLEYIFWRYTAMLAQGRDVEDVEPDPRAVELARARLDWWENTKYRVDGRSIRHYAVTEWREWKAQQEREKGNGRAQS